MDKLGGRFTYLLLNNKKKNRIIFVTIKLKLHGIKSNKGPREKTRFCLTICIKYKHAQFYSHPKWNKGTSSNEYIILYTQEKIPQDIVGTRKNQLLHFKVKQMILALQF